MTARVGYWRDRAENTIRKVMAALPTGVTLEERTKAVDAAYPFGPRSHTPYKVWLRARRKALLPFGHVPKGKGSKDGRQGHLPLSPLERAKAKSLAIKGGAK